MSEKLNLILDPSGKQKNVLTKEELQATINKDASKETKSAFEKSHGDKKVRIDLIYRVQEEMILRANELQKKALESNDDNYKRKCIFEIQKIGEFCAALEHEIKFIRNQ